MALARSRTVCTSLLGTRRMTSLAQAASTSWSEASVTSHRCWRAFSSSNERASFPDSWVEPEALWDFAQADSDTIMTLDEQFEAEFGRRNEQWRQRMLKADPGIFEEIGAGQAPKYLWLGCCDSRVAAENLVDTKPGEIFVHRNIANMVVSTDTNLRSVLQYAVEYLEVQHIIVCGHYDCGGVKAAVKKQDHRPPLESWLTNIRDVHRLHIEELSAILDEEERHKRLVELNVIEQCFNLFKTSDVQRRRALTAARPIEYEGAFPRIHGMIFDPSDGVLRRLPIDWKAKIAEYSQVYQIHIKEEYEE